MDIDFNQVVVEVTSNTFFNLDHADGTALICVSGALWVTRDHCMKDTVLVPGEVYEIEGNQAVTVTAFEPSTLRVLNSERLVARTVRSVHSSSLATIFSHWRNRFASMVFYRTHAR
ncbi:DUF2917 domain-containing protein [Noviherbaspirillum aerium]|uniref:DUF2917 domain-containing protein n=1 Tax=Noviherbaspirillum aerium TaxID=2588497 RepID=UPI00124DD8EC